MHDLHISPSRMSVKQHVQGESLLIVCYIHHTIKRVIALSELPIIRILTDTQANKGINANVCQECDLFKGDVTIPHRSFIFIVPANCISYQDLTFSARRLRRPRYVYYFQDFLHLPKNILFIASDV